MDWGTSGPLYCAEFILLVASANTQSVIFEHLEHFRTGGITTFPTLLFGASPNRPLEICGFFSLNFTDALIQFLITLAK